MLSLGKFYVFDMLGYDWVSYQKYLPFRDHSQRQYNPKICRALIIHSYPHGRQNLRALFFATTNNGREALLWVWRNFVNLQAVFWNLQVGKNVWLWSDRQNFWHQSAKFKFVCIPQQPTMPLKLILELLLFFFLDILEAWGSMLDYYRAWD